MVSETTTESVLKPVRPAERSPAMAAARPLAKWGLRGSWTTHWLNAPTRAGLAAVWHAYGVTVEPASNDIVHSLALFLIDLRGDERTAYLFPFLPSFVQRDLARLAGGPA